MGIDLQAVELPQSIQDNAEVIYDNIDDDSFEVTLSVSTREVSSKEEAKKVLDFSQQTFVASPDSDELESLFQTHLYSTNTWTTGCNNDAYAGMTGATLDFDHGFTIGEAQEQFAEWNYILHTSRTHQSSLGGTPEDRFRVILPFAPGQLYFTSSEEARKVYAKLMEMFPQADKSCTNPGRKFFPSTRELNTPFLLDIHVTGKYYSIDISDIPSNAVKPRATISYNPPEELNTREELDRMLKFCPFMQWCQAEANKGLPEPLWFAMISNLCRFEGGKDLIHKISAADPVSGRYDFDATEDKIKHAFENSGPIGYSYIKDLGWPGEVPEAPASPAGWAKLGRVIGRSRIGKEDVMHIRFDDDLTVLLNGRWRCHKRDNVKSQLKASKQRVQAVCPFCDYDNAHIRLDEFGFLEMWCDHCKACHHEHPDSPLLFCLGNELARVETRGATIASIEILDKSNFRTTFEYDYIKRLVVNDASRRFLNSDFQIRRQGDPKGTEVGVTLKVHDNAIELRYPPIEVRKQNNTVINDFLDRMFGDYSEFIKNWMAVYTYTNYKRLAVIALGGDRYAGKGTFANLVGKIYSKLFGHWDGDAKQFNPEFTSKLLFVDENRNSDKPTQYTELKRITGSETIAINDKFKSLYYVPNNINIIMATNDSRPVALKWGEEPRDEHVNNFFIFKCKSAVEVDNELGKKLEDCLGWYVRSELRERFEAISLSPDVRNRYVISTPITDYANEIYASAKTSVEEEAEELAEGVVRGVTSSKAYSTTGYAPLCIGDKCYIQPASLRKLIKLLKLTGSSHYTAYVNALVRAEVISAKNDHRESSKRLGHEILRAKTFYDEAGPVELDEK